MMGHRVGMERIPRFYDLGYNQRGTFVRMHKKAAEFVRAEPFPANMTEYFQKNAKLPDFVQPEKDKWGYGQVLTWHELPDGEVMCEYLRKREKMHGMMISASLSLLFDKLQLFDENSGDVRSQLMAVSMYPEPMRCSLSATMSNFFCRMLIPKTREDLEVAVNPMIKEFFALGPIKKGEISNHDFIAYKDTITEPRFFIQCFGDACDIGVSGSDRWYPEEGMELGPHNIDSAAQLLSLLAGLAAIWQKARDEWSLGK